MNLNQVTISSKDLEISVAFYKLLGLQLIVDALPRYARFTCPNGEATLSIHQKINMQSRDNTTVYFEDDTLKVLVFKLKQKGITFTSDIEDKSWLWTEAHLEDSDGNKIILFNAGKSRKNSPWRI